VHVYYSVDPDPRARFWRSAERVERQERRWTARLPILHVDQPLFAFANIHYRIEPTASEPHAASTSQLAISSLLHTAPPTELAAQQVAATDRRDPQIDDFAHGWRDWYTLSANNPHHWEYSTRKIADPKWRGAAGERLAFDVQAANGNALVIVLTENFFRSQRGPQREYVAVVPLAGGDEPQHVSLAPSDFQTLDGRPLASWQQLDLLSFRAYYERDNRLLGSKSWAGPQPVFRSLRWEQR
jgi:hypothetical protein